MSFESFGKRKMLGFSAHDLIAERSTEDDQQCFQKMHDYHLICFGRG